MDHGETPRSQHTTSRRPTRNSIPGSPLWQNIQAHDDGSETSTVNGTTTSQFLSSDHTFDFSHDDLIPLPQASLEYDIQSRHPASQASRLQSPRVGDEASGRGLGPATPSTLPSKQTHKLKHHHVIVSDKQPAAASYQTTAAYRPHLLGDSQNEHGATQRTSAQRTVPSPVMPAQAFPVLNPTTDSRQQEHIPNSKGVLQSLSRRGSTFLRRARGASKSDTDLGLPPSPSPAMTAMSPGSPLALSTMSPLSPPNPGLPGSIGSSPSIRPLPKPASLAHMSTLSDDGTSPTSPKVGGKTPGLLMGSKQKKQKLDELMTAYMSLDKDHERFHSRKVVLKANVVRDCVLPFLKTYASNPLNTSMTAEDLEIRAVILGKWWSTLLNMLKEIHNDRISGHDRPIVLDAIIGIMERPEWKLAMRGEVVGLEGYSSEEHRRRASSISAASSGRSSASIPTQPKSGSMGDNVRNLFVQNMLDQMKLVVEKMSQKTTPASLVTFCGKACAYAFFFCPGIADILVRLWAVHPIALKRVLEVFGISSPWRFQAEADAMLSFFPSSLHTLYFTSLKHAITTLRQKKKYGDELKDINWYGYWLKRWSGKDSDLFYAFAKQFHVLLAETVPRNALRHEWLCAPGVLPVYAQLLLNLDQTVHRQSEQRASLPTQQDGTKEEAAITFNDVLVTDVSADAFTPASINATRMIADQRLITLLRDLLPVRPPPFPPASHVFAEGFCDILRATATNTSMYDHAACFTLCDFLQEAIVILAEFENNASIESLIDWEFWLDVFAKMAQSENTLTCIRLYTLLYNIWPLIAGNARWKEHLCLRVLLDPVHFENRFSHYCPLVRTYFHRLLCWRVVRCDVAATDLDLRILRTVCDRLSRADQNFRLLQKSAQRTGRLLLETGPSLPAPNRRLLIIRTDVPPSPSSLSLEGLVPHVQSRTFDLPPAALGEDAGVDAVQLIERLNLADNDPEKARKKGSLFRSILGTRSPKVGSPKMTSGSQSPTRSASATSSRDASPQASPSMSPRTSLYQQRPAAPGRTGSSTSLRKSQETPKAGRSPAWKEGYFKFSLEIVAKNVEGMPKDYHKHPPRLPHQYQMLMDNKTHVRAERRDTAMEIPFATSSRYAGVALAEWHLVVNECQNFFERRKREGVPNNRMVETPALGVESLKRPG